MEPVTFIAIVTYIAAQQVVKDATQDAYQGLKEILNRKFGDESEIVEAVDMLEGRPESEARKGVLQEEVERAALDQDLGIREAAQKLLNQIGFQPGGEQHIQQARGNYIAQADHGSTAKVNVDHSRKLPEE